MWTVKDTMKLGTHWYFICAVGFRVFKQNCGKILDVYFCDDVVNKVPLETPSMLYAVIANDIELVQQHVQDEFPLETEVIAGTQFVQ